MRKLGVSIYLQNSDLKSVYDYIDLASSYGFKRIFTCLISKSDDKSFLDKFKDFVSYANSKDMQVIADIEPSIMNDLNIDFNDLTYFKNMGLYGIRLDLGFSGNEESIMSFDKNDLKIELNISNGSKYLENILEYSPNKNNILGCHNFYPREYTGLKRSHFLRTSKEYKEMGIKTAAFVSSSVAKYGPWELENGLPTLEEHRNLDIKTQAKDLFNTNLIDDIIISNMFASEKELKALSNINKNMLNLDIILEKNISDIERKIVLEQLHFNRGDINDYAIRSTQGRIAFKKDEIKPRKENYEFIKKGDITIDNSLYGRYKGELQIALKEMKHNSKTNIVGRIKENELYLLDTIKPWQKFKFTNLNE